jgi:hypothetical protein
MAGHIITTESSTDPTAAKVHSWRSQRPRTHARRRRGATASAATAPGSPTSI